MSNKQHTETADPHNKMPHGETDLNEQGPGPEPEEMLQNREHTPLEYA
jgi:hypothetical protein